LCWKRSKGRNDKLGKGGNHLRILLISSVCSEVRWAVAFMTPFLVGTRKVSLESAGPARPEWYVDNGPASSNARRRRFWKVERNGKKHDIARPKSWGYKFGRRRLPFATSDGFILIAWTVVVYLMMMLLLRPIAISYRDLRRCLMSVKMEERDHFRCVAVAALLSLAPVPQYGADVRKLSLKEAVELAISQNHSLRIARLKSSQTSRKRRVNTPHIFRDQGCRQRGRQYRSRSPCDTAGALGRVQGQLVPGSAAIFLRVCTTCCSMKRASLSRLPS